MITPEAIRHIRESLGLTQAQFAARLGVASWTVSRWERGTNSPYPKQAIRIREMAEDAKP